MLDKAKKALSELFAPQQEEEVKPKATKTRKPRKKKVVNKLNEADTALLSDFLEERISYLGKPLQLQLLAIIESEHGIKYNPTSCRKCFMGKIRDHLVDIAKENGIYNG